MRFQVFASKRTEFDTSRHADNGVVSEDIRVVSETSASTSDSQGKTSRWQPEASGGGVQFDRRFTLRSGGDVGGQVRV